MSRRSPRPPGALLLFPGAGADRTQAQLVAIDRAVADGLGWVVERADFPYRRAGRRAPDRPPVLLAAVQESATGLVQRTGLTPSRIVLGGRSMGGRICSMAVAAGLGGRGLVLVSYPLRPPGRPDKLGGRTAHFSGLRLPCLFVSGTGDAFGTPEELEAATAAIPGPVTHRWIDGGDHGLRTYDETVATMVHQWAGLVP